MTQHHEQFAASQDMAMVQDAHAAQRSLIAAGREQAAQWHDGRAVECVSLNTLHTKEGRDLLASTARTLAQFHADAAASIRKLTD